MVEGDREVADADVATFENPGRLQSRRVRTILPLARILPFRGRGQGSNAYVTRLHVRYDAKSFPEDLALMETGDRGNFQGRYVMRHPWTGPAACEAGDKYRAALPARFDREAQNLANLTGWSLADITARMKASGQAVPGRN